MPIMKLIRAALVMIVLGIINIPAFSQEALAPINSSLPPVQSQGQIEFLTGGIGQDESQAILREGGKWPLMLELAQSATPQAVYISDVQIIIRDAGGFTVLETITKGPFLLARLSPGKYSLDAIYEGNTLHRDLNLQKKHEKITLLWPAPQKPE